MGWFVYLLGDVRVRGGDRDITRFESRRAVACLARVALWPDRLHPREELAAWLWPDADRKTGLERLRHVLSSLTRQMTFPGAPSPLLLIDRQGVRANRALLWCDAVQFEADARAGRGDAARTLYRGDLLPGFYDDWVQEARERLRALWEPLAETDAAPSIAPAPPIQPAALAPPAARAGDTPRSTLPGYLTAFFGRAEEKRQIVRLLRQHRLVTLWGLGGIGKTRLAVEVCREVSRSDGQDDGAPADPFPIVWVPLADCVDAAQIPHRLRNALGVPASVSDTPLGQAATLIGERPALVVLDNLEQITASGAAEMVEDLLAALPSARFLITSRQALNVPGEQIFPLAPLPLPPDGETGADTSALDLWVDRARLSRPDFTVSDRNRADLARLCRLLDGLPLALELTAARVRAFTPSEMCRQLESGQRFMLAARPDVAQRKDPRHGSLRGALTWSARLLSPRAFDFFTVLSVPRGRFSRDTATALSGQTDAAALLEELASASLVQTHIEDGPNGDISRFSLLPTVREFAGEQGRSDRLHNARRAHAAHLVAIADDPRTLDSLLHEDLSPLFGAVDDAIEDGQTDEALRLCAALRNPWIAAGACATALDCLHRALTLHGGTPANRVAALVAGVDYACTDADAALAGRYAGEALTWAGDDPGDQASAQCAQAHVMYLRADPPELIDEAIRAALLLAHEAGRTRAQASLHALHGMLANRQGEWEEAEACYARAETLARQLGRASSVIQLGFKRAVVATDRGDFARARQLYAECRTVAIFERDRETLARIACNEGAVLAHECQWRDAEIAMKEGIEQARAIGSGYLMCLGLWNLAEPLAHLEAGADAALLLACASKYWRERVGPLSAEDEEHQDRVYVRAQQSLPAEQSLAHYMARGETLSLRDGIAFALK